MSEHLDQWFDRLRAQPPPTPFAPAEEVRRRGRRRAYQQHAAVATAVLAVVGLAAVGLGQLPGTSSSTVGALSPAATPTAGEEPRRIADDWFLTTADLGQGDWRQVGSVERNENDPPWLQVEVCPGFRPADYPSLVVRRNLVVRMWMRVATPESADESPDSMNRMDWVHRSQFDPATDLLFGDDQMVGLLRQTVDLLQPGEAQENLAEIRALVESCDPMSAGPSARPMHYEIVRTGFAGDESLLIAERWQDSISLIAVVRVGDVVTTLRSYGPSPEPERANPGWLLDMARVAAARLPDG